MKKVILLLCFTLFFSFLSAQQITNLQDLKEALKTNGVYAAPKNYKYQATKLDVQGDMLSTEIKKK